MKLWPFNRKKNQSADIPKEVQDYYQAEKREKVGVAGLLALGTLVVTMALAIGLYFGGRWAYRTVFDKNDQPQTAQQEDETDAEEESNPADTEPTEEELASGTDSEPAPAPRPTPAPAPAQQPGSQTTQRPTGDLPNTGPGNVLAVFLGTVALATGAHYSWNKKYADER